MECVARVKIADREGEGECVFLFYHKKLCIETLLEVRERERKREREEREREREREERARERERERGGWEERGADPAETDILVLSAWVDVR